MRHKTTVTVSLLAFCLCGALLTLGVKRPAAQAAPAAVNAPVSDILDGKTFPNTMKTEQFDTSYHIINLVDMQGKPGAYLTRGDTVTMGGESFLVAYYTNMTSGIAALPQPKPGENAMLALINMHYVQAITGIHALAPLPAKETDTP